MDLSTLLEPLLNVASIMKSYTTSAIAKGSHKSSSSTSHTTTASTLASLDRTLGTAASLGIAIGLFRVLKRLRDEFDEEHSNSNSNSNSHGHATKGTSSTTGTSTTASSSSSNSKANNIAVSIRSIVQVLIRGIMMGLGIKRLHTISSKDNITNNQNNINEWAKEAHFRTFSGSCHCKSITFILKAPNHIEAKDYCNGKIKYPHCVSNADDFQLLSGSQYLSKYFVELTDTNTNNDNHRQYFSSRQQQQQQQVIIAAHTFCNRCGVHILRAPNSHSNKLEVNTNCLDDFQTGDSTNATASQKMNNFISINVTNDENINGMGMGGGKPIFDTLNKERSSRKQHTTTTTTNHLTHNSHHPFEASGSGSSVSSNSSDYSSRLFPMRRNSHNSSNSSNSMISTAQRYFETGRQETQQPWPVVETVYEEDNVNVDNDMMIKWKEKQPNTPGTMSSTLLSGSCLSSTTTTDTASTSDGLSYDENEVGTSLLINNTTVDADGNVHVHEHGHGHEHTSNKNDDAMSLTGWPVASSLQSSTPRNNHDLMSTSSTASTLSPTTPTPNRTGDKSQPMSINKDQLKYYMTKHMTSSSPLVWKEEDLN